jgi:hypothetical protein
MLLIAARLYDVDREVRARVRIAVTSTALRNKNRFLVETAVEVCAPAISHALISDAERSAGRALILCLIGPSVRRKWMQITRAMYSDPAGVTFHRPSGWMFYVDRGLQSVRAVRATHVPASNYVAVPTEAGMKEPIGMALTGGTPFSSPTGGIARSTL